MRFQRWIGSNLKTAAACQSKTFESRIFRNGSKKFVKSKAEKYYVFGNGWAEECFIQVQSD